MAHWGTESGILRKNKVKETHEDLLVFGYACKLFRDDDKAAYIDKGKHLIPWMGDEKLKIDRYDCRGALSDISQYEASREGFDAMRWLGLDESERKLEQLCDKERYHSLHINEEEEEMYKEEEVKRQKANEYQYSYDVPMDPAQAQKEIGPAPAEPEEEDEDYVPSPQLDVPVDIALPKTVKENARIEKTALFICKQGPQMEILIKAKQADNPQFGFLNQGNSLYKYYRHVLQAIKSGRYQVITAKTEEKKDDANDGNDGHYLHPSLVSTTQPDVQTSSIPSVPYKPSANCSYTQLVSKIQGGAAAVQVAAAVVVEPPPPQQLQGQEGVLPVVLKTAETTYEQQQQQQQYYQYYYAAQYYEYYKQLAQYQQGGGDQTGQAVRPPETQLDPAMQNYVQQMAYTQYMQHQQNSTQNSQNPYAQIVSNVNKDVSNPYAQLLANMQPLVQQDQQQQQQQKPISKDPVIYTEDPKVVVGALPPQEMATAPVAPQVAATVLPKPEVVAKTEVVIQKPLLSLAQYGSGSESDEDEEMKTTEEEKDEFLSPTGEVQVVIDKMAMYVSKNGVQFEEIVKAKGDPRFEFLNGSHEFHKYYRSKIKEYQGGGGAKEKKAVTPPKVKEKKVITPVCFSIKKPKEEAPKEIKSALPMEESDDEVEHQGTSEIAAAPTVTPPTPVTPVDPSIIPPVVAKESESSEASNESSTASIAHKNGLIDADDPLLEMIDLTEDLEERKDLRRAEDKIKDKLAAAAREKMVSVARDRALQLERKKKAAAFLKLMNAESNTAVPEKVEVKKDEERVMMVTTTTTEKREKKEKTKSPVKSSRSRSHSRSKSRSRDKDRVKKREGKEVVEVSDSGTEDGDRRRHSSRRKKSHKRKHSKSKHSDDKKGKKKSKRKRTRRSGSESSNAS